MLGGKSLHAAGDQRCPEMGLMTDGWENGNYRSGMEITYPLRKKKKRQLHWDDPCGSDFM